MTKNLLNKLKNNSPSINSLLAFVIKIFSAGSSYVLFAVFAKILSAEDFGKFCLYFSFAMFVSLFGSFGQHIFLVKEIAVCQYQNDKKLEKGAYVFSFLSTIIVSLTSSVLLLLYIIIFSQSVSIESAIFCFALCLFYSCSQATIGALRALNKTNFAIFTRDLLWRILVVLFCYAFIYAFSVDIEGRPIIIYLAMVSVMAGIVCWHFVAIYREISVLLRAKAKFYVSEWLKTSFSLAIVAIISGSDLYIYTMVMSYLFDVSIVGAFFAALKTAELINLFLMSVSLAFSVELSNCIARKDFKNVQLICNFSMILLLIPTCVCAFLMIFFSAELMNVFDVEYVQYNNVLCFFVIGMLVNALTGSTVLLFQLLGMHRRHIIFQGGSLFASLLVLFPLVDIFGINGAAISFIISKLFWNIAAVISVRKKIGVDSTILALFGSRHISGQNVFSGIKFKLLEVVKL